MKSSFENFAKAYDNEMGDEGSFTHKHTIDPPLFDLIGNPSDLTIYDVACGNGYIARRLAREGANEVWASDISKELIEIAKSKYDTMEIKYSVRDAADFTDIPENHFDLVIMNMAIFYIVDVPKFAVSLYRILKPGGRFIFTLDHPLKSVARLAIGRNDIDIVKEGETYLQERKEKTFNNWTNKEGDLECYFRPIGHYINACGEAGLTTKAVRETATKMKLDGKIVSTNVPYKMAIKTVKA